VDKYITQVLQILLATVGSFMLN